MDGRSDRTLTDLLNEYADGVRSLTVPPPPRVLTQLEQQILGQSLRAVDRLGQALSEKELDTFELGLGVRLPTQVREWFGWANGHAPGAMDPDDSVANVFPFGRQMDIAAGSARFAAIERPLQDQPPPIPRSPVVVLDGDTRTFMVDCATADGVLWLWDVTAFLEPVFGSLREMVQNCIKLLRLDLIRLNFFGGAELVRPDELVATGVTFESEWESFRYQSYGSIPSALRN